MFSKVFLVFFLGLALLSSVAWGYPARDQRFSESSCSVSPSDSSKNHLTSELKNGGKGNDKGTDDPQKSLTLNPKVISKGFEQDGQENPSKGQVASLTSKNNFINFCLNANKPLTNGKQVKSGSCNPCIMGNIPSTKRMPSSKFQSPKNFGAVKANTNFTIKMQLKNLEAGNFVNAAANYYAAPQQLNKNGQIIGHTHFVVQAIDSFKSTKVADATKFAFFKGVNGAQDANGVVSVDVAGGLPEGQYRLASINTAANHQPALVPVAQHGFLDDMIYFSATKDGKPNTSSNNKDKSKSNNEEKNKSKSADPESCQVDKATTSSVNDYGS